MTVSQAFARARSQSRLACISYIMAGDPDIETTLVALHALTESGADIIELGVPYSDPLADGASVSAAAARALQSGTRIDDIFSTVKRAQKKGCAPIVLFGYYNPLLQYGLERFAQGAQAAGVCGAIVPDITLEELAGVRELFVRYELVMPLLVAPSTPIERAHRIADAATGFCYVVSRLGVTGASAAPDLAWVREMTTQLRVASKIPIVVGFGIARPEHVRALREIADGFVIGSALVDAYAGLRGATAAQRLSETLDPLVSASYIS